MMKEPDETKEMSSSGDQESPNDKHKSVKQWLWFLGLWCAGILAMVVLSSLVKLAFKLMT